MLGGYVLLPLQGRLAMLWKKKVEIAPTLTLPTAPTKTTTSLKLFRLFNGKYIDL